MSSYLEPGQLALKPARDLEKALVAGRSVEFRVPANAVEIAALVDGFAGRANRDSVELSQRGQRSATLSVILGPYDKRTGSPPTKRASFGRWRCTDLRLEWEAAATDSLVRARFETVPASRPSRLAYITNIAPLLFGVGAVLFALLNWREGALLVFMVGLGLTLSPAYQLLAVSKRSDRKALGRTLSSLFGELRAESDPYRKLGSPKAK